MPPSGATVRRLQTSVPIVIATYAKFAASAPVSVPGETPAGEPPVYDWVVVVKAAEDAMIDLSFLIASVEFILHPSFPSPKRVVKNPPFAIKEQGWGEFDIGIKISFRFPDYKPVHTSHLLRLYSTAPQSLVSNERLDTLCFTGELSIPDREHWPRMTPLSDALLVTAFSDFPEYAHVRSLEAAVAEDLERDLENSRNNLANLKDEIRKQEEIFLRKRIAELQ